LVGPGLGGVVTFKGAEKLKWPNLGKGNWGEKFPWKRGGFLGKGTLKNQPNHFGDF